MIGLCLNIQFGNVSSADIRVRSGPGAARNAGIGDRWLKQPFLRALQAAVLSPKAEGKKRLRQNHKNYPMYWLILTIQIPECRRALQSWIGYWEMD